MKHGTVNGYNNHHCRCEPCTKAKRDYNNDYRKRKNAEAKAANRKTQAQEARLRRRKGPIPGHVHGSWNGYSNYGCKCDRCLEACRARYPKSKEWRDANREYLNEYQRQYRETVLKPREKEKDELAKQKRLDR